MVRNCKCKFACEMEQREDLTLNSIPERWRDRFFSNILLTVKGLIKHNSLKSLNPDNHSKLGKNKETMGKWTIKCED